MSNFSINIVPADCLVPLDVRISAIRGTSYWAQWRIKSPALWLLAQPFVQAQNKENMTSPCHWPLWGESTGNRWNTENVSIWWRHHGYWGDKITVPYIYIYIYIYTEPIPILFWHTRPKSHWYMYDEVHQISFGPDWFQDGNSRQNTYQLFLLTMIFNAW